MKQNEFDRRYPAMFQPGGEHIEAEHVIPRPPAVPAPGPAAHRIPEQPAHRPPAPVKAAVPAAAAPFDPAEAEGPAPEAEMLENPAEKPQGGPKPASSRLPWTVPAALGLLMLVLGSLVLFLPQWVIPEADRDLSSYANGSADRMMFLLYTLAPAARPMVTGGLGILAIVFFLATRIRTARETGLRRLFAIVAVVLVGLGVVFQYSQFLMPEVTTKVVDAASGQTISYSTSPQLTMLLMQLAPAPLLVGVLMLTALFLGRGMSNARWWLAGTGLLAVAAVALFAVQLFPGIETSVRGGQPIPPWPNLLPVLAPALVAAAVFTLMAAALKDILRAKFAHTLPAHALPTAQAGGAHEAWDDAGH